MLELNNDWLRKLEEENVYVLNLQGCGISSIASETFNNLPPRINVIDLSNNEIALIAYGTFQTCKEEETSPHIHSLDLSSNEICSIAEQAFKSHILAVLTHLDLSHNHIASIDRSLFEGLGTLNFLDLSHNGITSIKARTFINLTMLRELDLSCNSISYMDSLSLDGLAALEEINLSKNQLASIDPQTFGGHKKHQKLSQSFKINFSANPYSLDPYLVFKEAFHFYQKKFKVYAPHLAKDGFKIVTDGEFTCEIRPLLKCLYLVSNVLISMRTFYSTQIASFFKYESRSSCGYGYKRVFDYLIQTDQIYTNTFLEQFFDLYLAEKTKQTVSDENNNGITQIEYKSLVKICERGCKSLLEKILLNGGISIDTLKKLCSVALSRSSDDILSGILNFLKKDLLMRLTFNRTSEDMKTRNYIEQELRTRIDQVMSFFLKLDIQQLILQVQRRKWWDAFEKLLDLSFVQLDTGENIYLFFILEQNRACKRSIRKEITEARRKSRFGWVAQVIRETKNRHPLYLIAESGRRELVKHQVAIKLLEKKWKYFPRAFYYIDLLLYVLFLILYANSSTFSLRADGTINVHVCYNSVTIITLIVLLLLFSSYEIIQLKIEHLGYFHSGQKHIEFIFYVLNGCALLTPVNSTRNFELFRFFVHTMGIVCAYIILLFKLKMLPYFGTFIDAFMQIWANSRKLLLLVFILLFAFMQSFTLLAKLTISKKCDLTSHLFTNRSNHGESLCMKERLFFDSTWWLSSLHMALMLTGNLELKGMGFGDHFTMDAVNAVNFVMYSLFIVLVPIFLFNLFIGIAVDEIGRILKEAEVRINEMQIFYVVRVERILENIFRLRIPCLKQLKRSFMRRIVKSYSIEIVKDKNYHHLKSISTEDLLQIILHKIDDIKTNTMSMRSDIQRIHRINMKHKHQADLRRIEQRKACEIRSMNMETRDILD